MTQNNDLMPYVFECKIDSDVVIACFDDYVKRIDKKTIIVLDNASVQTSKKFKAKRPEWEAQGLNFYYLPPYSPELNKIEILWKHIKYYWLNFSAYENYDSLYKSLEDVLQNVGKKWYIHFE